MSEAKHLANMLFLLTSHYKIADCTYQAQQQTDAAGQCRGF